MATTEANVATEPADIEPDPLDHYSQNADVYDAIEASLQSTYDYFESATHGERINLLNKAVSFALISAQTSVRLHEKGFLNIQDATTFTEIEASLLDAGVNYYRNKTKYLWHNMIEPDYDRVMDLYDQGRIDEMHRAIADEFKGVGLRKAGFAMALVVTGEKMCVDTNCAQIAGLEPDEIYNGVVVDRYENQCDEVLSNWPTLKSYKCPFMCQWIIFDTNLETVTTHDAWFMSLPDEIDISVM